jgi:hypothetical protein
MADEDAGLILEAQMSGDTMESLTEERAHLLTIIKRLSISGGQFIPSDRVYIESLERHRKTVPRDGALHAPSRENEDGRRHDFSC